MSGSSGVTEERGDETRAEIAAEIVELLAAFDDPAEMAAYFVEGEYDGIRWSASECVLADFFDRCLDGGGCALVTYTKRGFAWVHVFEDGGDQARLKLPPVAKRFARLFDDGKYPELIYRVSGVSS